jgi:hypothetical protein
MLVLGSAADALVHETVDAVESDACFSLALDSRASYVERTLGSREIHDDGDAISSNERVHELDTGEPDDASFAAFLVFFFLGLIAFGSVLSVCLDFVFLGDALAGDLSETVEASDVVRFGVGGASESHFGDAFTDFGLITFFDLGFAGDFDGVCGVFGSFVLLRGALGLVFLVNSL